jgi:hypothetical protein
MGAAALVVIYLVIGCLVAAGHLSSGREGASGKLPTFLFVALFWPMTGFLDND